MFCFFACRIAKTFSSTYQKKLTEKDTKAVGDPGVFSADFYLKSTSGNIQIGPPEVISMNETVCAPIILGEASDSSTVKSDEPVKMSVAFDCAAIGGVALVQVFLVAFIGLVTCTSMERRVVLMATVMMTLPA